MKSRQNSRMNGAFKRSAGIDDYQLADGQRPRKPLPLLALQHIQYLTGAIIIMVKCKYDIVVVLGSNYG